MRFDSEKEQEVGRAIRMAEMRAHEALSGLDAAERILRSRPKREERTRAGAVDRLEQAVLAIRNEAAQKKDPELFGYANEASRVSRACQGGSSAASLGSSMPMPSQTSSLPLPSPFRRP